ncbi:MAG: hypothetical protein WCO56_09395 [Verrucomicrobiota bacterium]
MPGSAGLSPAGFLFFLVWRANAGTFKHRYHPKHDNWDALYATKLPAGVEYSTINWAIQVQFSATDPDGLALAGYGDDIFGGIYRKTITGLHRNVLLVQGIFRLQLASSVPTLNDAP